MFEEATNTIELDSKEILNYLPVGIGPILNNYLDFVENNKEKIDELYKLRKEISYYDISTSPYWIKSYWLQFVVEEQNLNSDTQELTKFFIENFGKLEAVDDLQFAIVPNSKFKLHLPDWIWIRNNYHLMTQLGRVDEIIDDLKRRDVLSSLINKMEMQIATEKARIENLSWWERRKANKRIKRRRNYDSWL